MQEIKESNVLLSTNFWISLFGIILTGYIAYVMKTLRKDFKRVELDINHIAEKQRKLEDEIKQVCVDIAYTKGLTNGKKDD